MRISDWSSDVCSSDLSTRTCGDAVRQRGTQHRGRSFERARREPVALSAQPCTLHRVARPVRQQRGAGAEKEFPQTGVAGKLKVNAGEYAQHLARDRTSVV